MASSFSSSKAPCATCDNKAAGIFRCEGCLQVFCRKHLNEHRDLLSHQLDEIVIEHDTLRQMIDDKTDQQKYSHPFLKQIDEWERDSIVKIQQIAEEARQQLEKLTGFQRGKRKWRSLIFVYYY